MLWILKECRQQGNFNECRLLMFLWRNKKKNIHLKKIFYLDCFTDLILKAPFNIVDCVILSFFVTFREN